MVEDDDVEYSLAMSTDRLVLGIYVETAHPMSQDEFLKALQYFIDRTIEEEEDLFSDLNSLN